MYAMEKTNKPGNHGNMWSAWNNKHTRIQRIKLPKSEVGTKRSKWIEMVEENLRQLQIREI